MKFSNKKYVLSFCLFIISFSVFAQSKFTYDLQKDSMLGSISLGMAIAPFFVSPDKGDSIFNKDTINAFDRNLMFPYNKTLDSIGDVGAYGLALLPVVSLGGNIKDAKALASYGIMYAESLLLVFGTTELMKNLALRYRPYCYFGDAPQVKEADYYKSFPSRHAAFAFMSTGFLCYTFLTEYPDSAWKIPVIALSYSLALGVGASRVFSGNHFVSDVLTGAAIGSLYGYLVPILHLQKKNIAIAISPVINGLVISGRF
jgi:undecaprenyl-diphosphatase